MNVLQSLTTVAPVNPAQALIDDMQTHLTAYREGKPGEAAYLKKRREDLVAIEWESNFIFGIAICQVPAEQKQNFTIIKEQ